MGLFNRRLTVEEAVESQNIPIRARNEAAELKAKLPGQGPAKLEPLIPQSKIDNQVAILKKMGFTNGEHVGYFMAEVDSNPKLAAVFSRFEEGFAKDPKYAPLLQKMGAEVLRDGQKIGFDTDDAAKKGTGIIDKLAKDLSDGTTADKFSRKLSTDPQGFEKKFDDYIAGRSSLTDILADAAPSTTGPIEAAVTTGTARATPAVKSSAAASPPARSKPASAAPVYAPAPASPAATAAVPPVETAVAPSTDVSAASVQTQTGGRSAVEVRLLESLSKASDEEIKGLTKADTRILATAMADKATKLGVPAAQVNGFMHRIMTERELGDKITKNFQNNPEFIRQLAKAGLDESPMPESVKGLAQRAMGEVMENADKLADSKYVSGLTSQMKMGSTMSGFGGILSKFGIDLSGIGNFFQGVFDWVRNFVNEFTGGNFASMQSSGRGFFGAFQQSARNASMNADMEASMRGKLKVEPLIGADGKPTYKHAEPVRDEKGQIMMDSGQQVTQQVLNKIEVETMGGKVKVLPTSGAEAVRQPDGSYKVWLADTMDDQGRPQKLIQASMTADQFETYNANLRQYGDRNNPPQYKMYDEATRGPQQRPASLETSVARVDRQSGAVTESARDQRYRDQSSDLSGPSLQQT